MMIGSLNRTSSLWVMLIVLATAVHPAVVVVVEGATFQAEIAELPDATVPGVSGTVVAFEDGTAIGYGGFLTGLQSGLEAANCTAENGCGVHVHSGTSCESTETQGGHYYDAAVVEVDPWLEARYSSDEDGSATFSGIVVAGATDLAGRPFVVHAEDGSRIACGILQLVDESEYLSTETVALTEAESGIGSVVVYPLENSGRVCFMGSAVDLEANLASFLTADGSDCTQENGCGAHVHEGMDCTNTTTQLGHFYNSDALAEDPWALVGYLSTDDSGFARFMDCLAPQVEEYDGRAFIVHANDGSRVSCGLLQRGATTTLSPTTSPAPAGTPAETPSSAFRRGLVVSMMVLLAAGVW